MKLLVKVPYDATLVIGGTPNSGLLLQAFTEAKLVKSEGYGKDQKWVELAADQQVEFEVRPDNFMDEVKPNDPLRLLQQEKQAAESRWVEYYTKSNDLDKQLKALQADLDARGITYTKPA